MLSAQTAASGKVVLADRGESRFAFSSAQQARFSPCKLTSEDSAGTLSAFELSVLPQSGPYLHVHHREDEWYYVLSGAFLFVAGGEHHELPTGASIWLPRGIPHTWANTAATEGRLILVCQPGGFETYFEDMGREMEMAGDSVSAVQKLKEVMSRHGMELLGPPLFKPLGRKDKD